MFGKKKCGNCGEKVSDSYSFCPYCRSSLGKHDANNDGEWGLLGKTDSLDEINMPSGFNHLFNSLLNGLNTQFKELENQAKKEQKKSISKKGGISISISTSGGRPPEIKIASFGNVPDLKEIEALKKTRTIKLPSSDSKKFFGLPKKEPETNIRRLSNKVVYEINLPGVKSTNDLSIIQLENSIEIKALARDKVFHKIIPISLPIKDYSLSKGKLVLELDARE